MRSAAAFADARRRALLHLAARGLPESAASRHALAMAISSAPLADAWSLREMRICVRSLEPSFARELVDLLVADAQGRLALD